MKVIQISKITKKSDPYYITLSNAYARLEELSENPGPPPETQTKKQKLLPKHQSVFKIKSARRLQTIFESYISKINDNGIFDLYINKAEDESTVMAKNNLKNALLFQYIFSTDLEVNLLYFIFNHFICWKQS